MVWTRFDQWFHGRAASVSLAARFADQEDVQRALCGFVGARATPGIAVALVEGEHVQVSSAGQADARSERPFDGDVPCRWFSVTKLVSATCAVILHERGSVDLDRPVHETLAVFPKPAPGRAAVTGRDLLAHTAGLPHPFPVNWVRTLDEPEPAPEAFLERALRGTRPVGGAPANYTNLGYLVLERWLEVATGRPFERLVRETVLEPLGMNHTGFEPHGVRGAVAASGHQRRGATGYAVQALVPRARKFIDGTTPQFYVLRPFAPVGLGYGSLLGPVRDLARLMSFFLREGVGPEGERVLSAEGVASMLTEWGRGEARTGLGWLYEDDAWAHEGAAVGFRSGVRLDRARRRAAVVLTPVTAFDVGALCRALLA